MPTPFNFCVPFGTARQMKSCFIWQLCYCLASFGNPAVSSVTATPSQQADDYNASWSRHRRGNIFANLTRLTFAMSV
jgi:hypothetical protein